MKVLLGITGSVAATLTPKIVTKLLKAGHEVKVVATDRGLYFVPPDYICRPIVPEGVYQPIYIWCETEKRVELVEVFIDKYEWPACEFHKGDPVQHIEFRTWADVLLIAPLTANTLAKIAFGICDTFLASIAYAWPKEKSVVLAPAMNTVMWENPITARNLEWLRPVFQSLTVIDPIEGNLACGGTGKGAMAKIDDIVAVVNSL